MTDWPDEKIRSTALWYIRKHSTAQAAWRWTELEEPHPEVLRLAYLQAGELPIFSFFRSEASWSLFTTRRIVGCHSGEAVEIAAPKGVKGSFGNFKGHNARQTEVMRLQASDRTEATLEYETFPASMAAIYYVMYWQRKYPILNKLKAKP